MFDIFNPPRLDFFNKDRASTFLQCLQKLQTFFLFVKNICKFASNFYNLREKTKYWVIKKTNAVRNVV